MPSITVYQPTNSLVVTACAASIFFSIVISSQTLNLFINFTTSGGSILEKIHPAVYLIIFAKIVSLFLNGPKTKEGFNTAILIMSWTVLFIYLVITNKFGYAAIIINNFIAAIILYSLILDFSMPDLRKLTSILIFLAVIQAILVISEYTIGTTFLPVIQEEKYFRPAGLAGHPIFAGVLANVGMLATYLFVNRYAANRLLILLFIANISVLGVRGPLIVCVIILFTTLLWPKNAKHRHLKYRLLDFLFIFSSLLLVVIFLLGGSFDRVLDLGLFDTSSLSRIYVFNMLDLFTITELWFGIEAARVELFLEHLKLSYVESPFVAQIIIGGIILAVPAHLLIILFTLNIYRVSKLLCVVILFMLFSTLIFSSKNTLPLVLAALMGCASLQKKQHAFD